MCESSASRSGTVNMTIATSPTIEMVMDHDSGCAKT